MWSRALEVFGMQLQQRETAGAVVCVCVCTPWNHRDPFGLFLLLVSSFAAGGHSISLGLCPMKLPVKWDIQLGQLDVPAIFQISEWQEAKPRTSKI